MPILDEVSRRDGCKLTNMLHEQGGDIDRPELVLGSRVRVIKDPDWNGPCPDEPSGRLESPEAGKVFLTTESRWGKVRQFKVRFDSPQRDADGQGPYVSAVIW